MNTQPIQKQDLCPDGTLIVYSMFYTIQGEGPYAGQPAVFIRLAGCNLQCPLCDTEYTKGATVMGYLDLLADVKELIPNPVELVVITGGEPFRQNLTPFVTALLSAGLRVQIETNGTLFLPRGNAIDPGFPYQDVTIVCSPKTGKINKYLLPHIDAYKYVLTAGSVDRIDGLPLRALEHPAPKKLAKPHGGTPIYVQPADSGEDHQNKRNLEAAIKSCMKFGYTLCIQIHKIIGME